ncbi:hypothetical protein F5B18DRAFT_621448 [Nemania serpens]|nr:hypothetical protein F5B18DRAFT_621448 [Nemania serpens]
MAIEQHLLWQLHFTIYAAKPSVTSDDNRAYPTFHTTLSRINPILSYLDKPEISESNLNMSVSGLLESLDKTIEADKRPKWHMCNTCGLLFTKPNKLGSELEKEYQEKYDDGSQHTLVTGSPLDNPCPCGEFQSFSSWPHYISHMRSGHCTHSRRLPLCHPRYAYDGEKIVQDGTDSCREITKKAEENHERARQLLPKLLRGWQKTDEETAQPDGEPSVCRPES